MNTPATPDHLAALLADVARAGMRPLPIGSATRLLDAAAANGYCARRIELGGCEGKADLLDRFAEALAFPAWFGHNWDAFADVLGDLSWLDAPGYVLLLEHSADMRTKYAEDFDTALDILREASRTWAAEGVPFWIFLDLAVQADT